MSGKPLIEADVRLRQDASQRMELRGWLRGTELASSQVDPVPSIRRQVNARVPRRGGNHISGRPERSAFQLTVTSPNSAAAAVIGNVAAEANYAAANVYAPAYNYFSSLGLSARQSTVGAVTFYNHGHMGQIANVLAQSQALGYGGYAGLDNFTPQSGGNYTSNVISIRNELLWL
jgi:hypothetical protein